MKTVLSIAGSDCSGGAGIQADLKTITSLGLYGMSAITALTAQNTCGIRSVEEVSPGFLADQLNVIFEDIFPDGVKIGMVSSDKLIRIIIDKLDQFQPKNVVIDSVMVATSGSNLLDQDSLGALEELFSRGDLLTPNMAEAQAIAGLKINDKKDMEKAGEKIYQTYQVPVLVKGGHLEDRADDLLYSKDGARWYMGERIENENTHGTGCTLSSAIAVYLAKGLNLEEAIDKAKAYVRGAIQAGLDLGECRGPLNHMWQG